jgi:hypothetical protein
VTARYVRSIVRRQEDNLEGEKVTGRYVRSILRRQEDNFEGEKVTRRYVRSSNGDRKKC